MIVEALPIQLIPSYMPIFKEDFFKAKLVYPYYIITMTNFI